MLYPESAGRAERAGEKTSGGWSPGGYGWQPGFRIEHLTLAGVAAPRQIWDWFNRAWSELLKAGDVTQFHMSDMENRRGEFSHWSDDFRKKFLSYVIQILQKPDFFPFGVTTLMDDWNAMPEWRRKWFKDPYAAGVAIIIQAVSQSFTNVEKINFVFDRVPRLAGAAKEAYEFVRDEKEYRDVVGSFEFASSKERLPLQAADFVAYEYAKFARNKLFDPKRRMRWTIARLAEKPHAFLVTQFSDEAQFERWL